MTELQKERLEKVCAFIDANFDRKVSRKEILTFIGIKDFRSIKVVLNSLPEEEKERYCSRICDSRSEKLTLPLKFPNENLVSDNSEAKTFNLSSLLLTKIEKFEEKNIVFDTVLFKDKAFFDILGEILKMEIKPIINLFENQFFDLDKVKDTNPVATEVIRFFAHDSERKYTKLWQKDLPTKKELGFFCKNQKALFVSGDPYLIANLKLENVDIYIPEKFKRKYPNPMKGDKVLGFDTCFTNTPKEELENILNDASKIIISDIQAAEMKQNTYLMYICSYYGEYHYALEKGKNADHSIVLFYKNQTNVDIVFTCDSGFKVCADINGLKSCYLSCKNHNPSRIKAKLESRKIVHLSNQTVTGIVKLDEFINKLENKYYFPSNFVGGISVKVFSSTFKRITTINSWYPIENEYIIALKEQKNILVLKVTDIEKLKGEVLYSGSVDGCDRRFS